MQGSAQTCLSKIGPSGVIVGQRNFAWSPKGSLQLKTTGKRAAFYQCNKVAIKLGFIFFLSLPVIY